MQALNPRDQAVLWLDGGVATLVTVLNALNYMTGTHQSELGLVALLVSPGTRKAHQ